MAIRREPSIARLAKSLRDRRRGLVGWTLAVIGLVTIQLSVYPTVRDSQSGWQTATESFPEVFRKMFRITDYTSEVGYLSTELMSFMVPLLFVGLGASWGSRLTTEDEENGTADVVLALPVSRRTFFLTRFAAAFAALGLTGVGFGTVLAIGARILDMSIGISRFAEASFVLIEIGAISLVIAALVGSAFGHRSVALAGSMSFGVVAFVAYSLSPIARFFGDLDPVNPWTWTVESDPLANGYSTSTLWSLLVVIPVSIAALRIFERRDIVG